MHNEKKNVQKTENYIIHLPKNLSSIPTSVSHVGLVLVEKILVKVKVCDVIQLFH